MPLSYSSYKEGYSSDSISIDNQQLASSVSVNNNLTKDIESTIMQIVEKINSIEKKIREQLSINNNAN